MNELTIEGKTYVSSKRAAEITGYAKDYVGQLCREGRVEARLVGRNWYILEESIREHRFGEEKKAKDGPRKLEEKAFASSSWESPRYQPESLSSIPSLAPRLSVNAIRSENSDQEAASVQDQSSILHDMQSAWQDWFSSKQTQMEEVEAESEAVESKEQSVLLQSLAEEGVAEEQVPIETTSYEPETTLDLSGKIIREVEVTATEEVREGRIVGEEVLRRERITFAAPTIIVRALLIAIMLICIAITAVGTGLATKYGGQSISRLSEIPIITGKSVFKR